jgi:alkylation response protein AidB-like acyl-CoA dehydrogenase
LLIKDTQDWVARARALAPMLEAAAARTETERKIPADVLSAMHACGLFHMLLPVSLGGGAVDLVTFNHIAIVKIARIYGLFRLPGRGVSAMCP